MNEKEKQAMVRIDKQLDLIPHIPKDEWGVEYKGECMCGGTLTAVRSTYNGHYMCKCDSCKFMMME